MVTLRVIGQEVTNVITDRRATLEEFTSDGTLVGGKTKKSLSLRWLRLAGALRFSRKVK